MKNVKRKITGRKISREEIENALREFVRICEDADHEAQFGAIVTPTWQHVPPKRLRKAYVAGKKALGEKP